MQGYFSYYKVDYRQAILAWNVQVESPIQLHHSWGPWIVNCYGEARLVGCFEVYFSLYLARIMMNAYDKKGGKLCLTFLSEPIKTPKKDQSHLSFLSFWVWVALTDFTLTNKFVLTFLSKVLCVTYFVISWCCSFSTCMTFWMGPIHPPKVLVMINSLTLLNRKDTWRKKVEWSKRKVQSVRQENGKC